MRAKVCALSLVDETGRLGLEELFDFVRRGLLAYSLGFGFADHAFLDEQL